MQPTAGNCGAGRSAARSAAASLLIPPTASRRSPWRRVSQKSSGRRKSLPQRSWFSDWIPIDEARALVKRLFPSMAAGLARTTIADTISPRGVDPEVLREEKLLDLGLRPNWRSFGI